LAALAEPSGWTVVNELGGFDKTPKKARLAVRKKKGER
jgi:hypothetical protein